MTPYSQTCADPNNVESDPRYPPNYVESVEFQEIGFCRDKIIYTCESKSIKKTGCDGGIDWSSYDYGCHTWGLSGRYSACLGGSNSTGGNGTSPGPRNGAVARNGIGLIMLVISMISFMW